MHGMQHHAICYDDPTFAKAELAAYFDAVDPDIHIETFGDFGIAEARRLTVRASMMPVAAPKHIFVVCVTNLTHEAQNALLKLLEEPPGRVQFYLIVPKRGLLLPTLQSRLFFVDSPENTATTAVSQTFTDFHHASLGDRLTQVANLSKEKATAKIEEIVAGAEIIARDTRDEKLLRSVILVRDHLGRRGASTKMLLEDLALTLPQVRV